MIKQIQGFYVACTNTWEGPGRHDYMAAMADLLDHQQNHDDQAEQWLADSLAE